MGGGGLTSEKFNGKIFQQLSLFSDKLMKSVQNDEDTKTHNVVALDNHN